MTGLTESDKLKYWLDAEISWLHVMIAIVMFMLVSSVIIKIVLVLYMVWSFVYMIVRLAYLASHDSSFLRIPRK